MKNRSEIGSDKTPISSSEEKPGKKEMHLLVIRLSALGDVAASVPVLRAFANCNPGVKLTVLSKPFFKPLFEGIPNLNFYGADIKTRHKGIPGLWKLANELHSLKIDAVADLHHVLRSNILRFFFRLRGIPVICIDKGRKEKKALTRKDNKIFKALKSTHQRYADVFEGLGFPIDLSCYELPPKKTLRPELSKIIGSDDKKRIGIAPFAAHSGKAYPLDLMEEVIATLSKTDTFKLLLFGGGAEETAALQRIAIQHEHVINAAGVFSFEEELALISNLDLMLAMDSGNGHLAAMYGVKVITLWGVTHPFAGFSPFGQPLESALLSDRGQYPLIPTSVYGNKYPEDYEHVMRSIPPELVVEKVLESLKPDKREPKKKNN